MRLAALILIMAFAPGLVAAGARHPRPAARHLATRHAIPARHTVLSMSVDDFAASPAAYHALAVADDGPLRLAVDRRLGRSAWVGSLGYHHDAAAAALNVHAVNSAAGVQFGQPDSTVGAKVSLPF